MTPTPGLDEILRLLPTSEKRRRVLPVPVHPESIIGADYTIPGCACDLAQIVSPKCLEQGGCAK